jgi:hypothetical protein
VRCSVPLRTGAGPLCRARRLRRTTRIRERGGNVRELGVPRVGVSEARNIISRKDLRPSHRTEGRAVGSKTGFVRGHSRNARRPPDRADPGARPVGGGARAVTQGCDAGGRGVCLGCHEHAVGPGGVGEPRPVGASPYKQSSWNRPRLFPVPGIVVDRGRRGAGFSGPLMGGIHQRERSRGTPPRPERRRRKMFDFP